MLAKESKIRVLENFYALDYVFFGKSVNEMESCCPLVKEEYLSVKGALLSVYVEMLKLTNHKPKTIEERVNGKALLSTAKKSARIARENSQKIVASENARKNIKSMLKEELKENPDVDIAQLVEDKIRMKAFGLAVDNLLIARLVKESESISKLNEWEGQIIEDSYKILRDSLIESAYAILYSESEVEEVEEGVENIEEILPVVAGAAAGAVGGLAMLRLKARKYCEKFKENPEKHKACVKDVMKKGMIRSQHAKDYRAQKKAQKK
jgi:hypothetical protein